jgi:hypothetical protein
VGVLFVSDLCLFKLARGEPFMFLAQLDGDFGNGLLVFDWQLAGADEGSQISGGCLLARAKLAQRNLLVIRGRGFVGDRVQSRCEGFRHDPPPQGEIVDQDERLVVPVFGAHCPADERADRPPFCDSRTGCTFLRMTLRIEDRLDLVVQVAQLDCLTMIDLFDFLAGNGIERLDAPFVHHRHLADQLVRRARARVLNLVGSQRRDHGRP